MTKPICLHVSCGLQRAHYKADDKGMENFTNQTSRHVARFVYECMQLREDKPDLTGLLMLGLA